ncbi:hypothetical protein FN846DRAFT_893251 [Sphaerosporella brunnea]|uniref:Uncharacterized protein n=1 Tax=Sphaerosporella brunnea TaxID=1250544 RepID=A0A5J5ENX4_9PEZI|nr:hypothetical protein FN846DRAFT_893251 [Sphaerosporella brunnea]
MPLPKTSDLLDCIDITDEDAHGYPSPREASISSWTKRTLNIAAHDISMLEFALAGGFVNYHLERDLIDRWESLTRTVKEQIEVQWDAIYDIFDDPIQETICDRVCGACPYIFGRFLLIGSQS